MNGWDCEYNVPLQLCPELDRWSTRPLNLGRHLRLTLTGSPSFHTEGRKSIGSRNFFFGIEKTLLALSFYTIYASKDIVTISHLSEKQGILEFRVAATGQNPAIDVVDPWVCVILSVCLSFGWEGGSRTRIRNRRNRTTHEETSTSWAYFLFSRHSRVAIVPVVREQTLDEKKVYTRQRKFSAYTTYL